MLQKGFSTILVLISAVLIIAVAFLIWKLASKSQEVSQAVSTQKVEKTGSSQISQDPNELPLKLKSPHPLPM